jgi:MFS family permease
MSTRLEMPRGREILMLAGLFMSTMCTMGDLVITPIVSRLFEYYVDYPAALINFGITGPSLVGLPFSLFAGWLCDHFDKKKIMVIGFAIFTLSSVFGAAVDNIYYFVVMRCLATGACWGITNTAGLAILADLYVDKGSHGKMIGFYNAIMSLMGALLSVLAGTLVVNSGWQIAFQSYWIALPVLVLLVVFLPSLPPRNDAVMSQAGGPERTAVWLRSVLPLAVQIFCIAVIYYVAFYMVSLFVTDAGVGDEAYTGIIVSVMTVAAALSSSVFGIFYKRLKRAVYLIPVAIIGITLIVEAKAPTPASVLLCSGVMGFCWPFFFCYFYAHATELVPKQRQGSATGIVAFFNGLAMFCSSYLITMLMNVTGMNAVSLWPYLGCALVVIVIVSGLVLGAWRRYGVASHS